MDSNSGECQMFVPQATPGGWYLTHLDDDTKCLDLASDTIVTATCTPGAAWEDQTPEADGLRFPLRPMARCPGDGVVTRKLRRIGLVHSLHYRNASADLNTSIEERRLCG